MSESITHPIDQSNELIDPNKVENPALPMASAGKYILILCAVGIDLVQRYMPVIAFCGYISRS